VADEAGFDYFIFARPARRRRQHWRGFQKFPTWRTYWHMPFARQFAIVGGLDWRPSVGLWAKRTHLSMPETMASRNSMNLCGHSHIWRSSIDLMPQDLSTSKCAWS